MRKSIQVSLLIVLASLTNTAYSQGPKPPDEPPPPELSSKHSTSESLIETLSIHKFLELLALRNITKDERTNARDTEKTQTENNVNKRGMH